ncbi:MAG: kelch repeat-containing protein, partial [Bacteroidota bacterium]
MKELVVFLLLSSFEMLTNNAHQDILKVYTCVDECKKSGSSVNFTIPQGRWAHQMTYDDERGRVLLFGGSHGDTILSDLWTWDGSKWKEITADGPPAINKGVFVYDASRKTNVLFGGANNEDKNVGDTWEWDGRNWKQLKVKGPEARVHALGVYDYKNRVVLIFGGFGDSGVLNDTWSFDGKKWKKMNTNGPIDCLPNGMIYDEIRKTVIMITVMLKADPSTGKPGNEMWEWTGTEWEKLSNATPSINGLQAFASFGNNEILLFDGNDDTGNKGTTWKYSSNKW